MPLRKTKIICTLGPASDTKETISSMIAAGMDVARLNFSHGGPEEKGGRIKILQEINKSRDRPITIVSDLKGPEIRVDTEKQNLEIKAGDKIFFSLDEKEVQADKKPYTVFVNVQAFPKMDDAGLLTSVQRGAGNIMVEDGLLEFEIVKSDKTTAECVAKNSGILKHNKGVNIPQAGHQGPTFTEKDWKDIEYSVKNNVDFIAASFVKTKKDVLELKDYLKNNGTQIISKIECQEALNNIDEIIGSSDAVMVARGDLGMDVPLETLPTLQYQMVKKCNQAGKPVIVATQMLNSMIENPRPTRAEVTDVANAIYMGADCVMLSGETANGKYPVETVSMMNKIAVSIEKEVRNKINRYEIKKDDIYSIVGKAVAMSADSIKADAILSLTNRGDAAKMLSRYRVQSPIYVLTPKPEVCKFLSLFWGIFAYKVPIVGNVNEIIEKGVCFLENKQKIKKGDNIVITANLPSSSGGQRNIAEIRKV